MGLTIFLFSNDNVPEKSIELTNEKATLSGQIGNFIGKENNRFYFTLFFLHGFKPSSVMQAWCMQQH